MTKVLITGAAGFIGYHTVQRFCQEVTLYDVVGIDNINDYYYTSLKYNRLLNLGISSDKTLYGIPVVSEKWENFKFIRYDITDSASIIRLFQQEQFDIVIHLAAQAGVRYSIENPKSYIDSNIVGFLNILEACRHAGISKLIYASSSSIYGITDKQPFSIDDKVDNPVSLYAATKKSNELMAYSYSHLYHMNTIGLRFFTVYGPFGRPDMAPWLFTEAISKNKPIKVFNYGEMYRDFTYINDIVEGIYKISNQDETNFKNKYTILNIGNGKPVSLLYFIECIERQLGKKANKIMSPMQLGDVVSTWADITELENIIHYKPITSIEEGVKMFVQWYMAYINDK